jgi:hypothetical protein
MKENFLHFLFLFWLILKIYILLSSDGVVLEPRWPRGLCARRAIVEAKQRWSFFRLVTKS